VEQLAISSGLVLVGSQEKSRSGRHHVDRTDHAADVVDAVLAAETWCVVVGHSNGSIPERAQARGGWMSTDLLVRWVHAARLRAPLDSMTRVSDAAQVSAMRDGRRTRSQASTWPASAWRCRS